jgi:hypothetical protein
MTTNISVEIIYDLLLKVAEYCGPAAYQYVKIHMESGLLPETEVHRLAGFFRRYEDPDLVEETCYQAMQRNRSVDLADLLEEIEKNW